MGRTQETVGNLPPPDPAELAEFKKQTRALYDMKEAAVAAGNLEPLLARFYAQDAMSFGPDAKIIRGRGEFKGIYEEFAKNILSLTITSIHAYVNGNIGWDWANIENKVKGGSKLHVAILFLWVKINGLWVSAGDTFTISPDKPIVWQVTRPASEAHRR